MHEHTEHKHTTHYQTKESIKMTMIFKDGDWVEQDSELAEAHKAIELRREKNRLAENAKKREEKRQCENKQKQIEIKAQNMLDPNKRMCYKLTEYLGELYELDVQVIFRNMSGSDHYKSKKSDTHIIRYGYECLDIITSTGYQEYIKVAKSGVWGSITSFYRKVSTYKHISIKSKTMHSDIKNEKAAYMLVLHEFAHAIQVERGGRLRNDVHNKCFIDCLAELIELVTYEDAREIARS
jgi:hypothetical protein